MELRKIQVTGGSTHVVSLPKKWIDRNRLGQSDAIAIHEEPDGTLLLIPHSEARTAPRSVEVRLTANPAPEEVVRRLVGAYIAGADEVRVTGEGRLPAKVRDTIGQVTRMLVGVEIQEETADSMTLLDLVGVADIDLRKTLGRMHRIARLMYDDALRALASLDVELAGEVRRRDDELDRLLWMVSKQMHSLLEQPRLAARLNVRPAEALNLFLAARALERVGDHAVKICANVQALQGQALPPEVVQQLGAQAAKVAAIWEEAFQSLKRPDFAQASRAADAGEEAGAWRASFLHHLRGLDPGIVGPLALVADSIDRTRGYAVDLAETAMNQTYQQP
jgi:phosphate uptake regulator